MCKSGLRRSHATERRMHPRHPLLPAVGCVNAFPVVGRTAGQGHWLWLLGCFESGQVDLILMLREPSSKGLLRNFHTWNRVHPGGRRCFRVIVESSGITPGPADRPVAREKGPATLGLHSCSPLEEVGYRRKSTRILSPLPLPIP